MLSDVAESKSMKHRDVAERNLVLVHRPGSQDASDFFRISDLIRERAPDIDVFVASTEGPCSATCKRAARRPTLVVSPTPMFAFSPLRGKVYCGDTMLKTEQMRRLKAAGLPVPEWVVLSPQVRLYTNRWGPFIITKPVLSSFGQGIRLMRTCDVNPANPLGLQANDPRAAFSMVAQKFIDTGPYPSEYRILTLFGRVLYCNRVAATEPRVALDASQPVELDGRIGVHPRNHVSEYNFDEDVLDLAQKTAAILSEVPVHAIDVLREAETGKIYVLEANSGGNAWHLSSPHGKRFQAHFKIDLYGQFDALSVAADALIEKTRAEAE